MTAGVTLAAGPAGPRAALAGLLRAWRSLQRRELAWFLWFGGVIGAMNALSLADGRIGGGNPALIVTEALQPVVCALILMAAWLPADRSDPAHPRRVHRLALAVGAASAVAALLVPALIDALALPTVIGWASETKGLAEPSWAAGFVASLLSMAMPSGLAVAVIEMTRRHRRSEAAMARALHEHAALARSALESRLAAMQAQVEPRFLFDVLVDIERLHADAGAPGTAEAGAQARARGSAQMDRLITYLRGALPRLRDSGSTLGAEVDLLASYLDLVQALHEGHPRFDARVPDALRQAVFHPMLLLPLAQRAVRADGLPPPERIELQARAVPHSGERGLAVELTLATHGLCAGDDELQRLRERLEVLYGGAASLACEEFALDGRIHSRFTLTVPR
ncbi:histidine kinase [Piscinibacter sakaiensis]|uniref:Autolysin sensor kinase n=1 Tax=Piscinibacter sakaiensis TaxID=1547922 RepID=A0A0K8P5H3_PISS1|nr:histidine kinase [Piscinibacter sakaiensis]GAP37862.1 autolysin sensor kinase [Piscinibacter sakaiensis]